jgi:hypothetical protein
MTGREHRDIQHSIMAVIAGAVPPRFLCTIHAMVDFIYQVQSPVLSETSISWFVNALREFHDEKGAITEAGACMGTKGMIEHFNIPNVTCRWHVLLDVSWIRSVANSTEVAVLSSDPEPLLAESFGELTGSLSEIRVFRYDSAGEYPGRTR